MYTKGHLENVKIHKWINIDHCGPITRNEDNWQCIMCDFFYYAYAYIFQ